MYTVRMLAQHELFTNAARAGHEREGRQVSEQRTVLFVCLHGMGMNRFAPARAEQLADEVRHG